MSSIWVRAGLLIALLAGLSTAAATQESRTFTGVVSDELCAVGGHAAMRMGPTDAECARVCAEEHAAALVLVAGEHVYKLSDQKQAHERAGTRVRVVGVLDVATDTIRVTSMTPDSPQ